MPRVYTRVFSDEAYAAQLPSSQPAVVIAAGSKRMVRLKVGSEGRVTDLVVKQLETDAPQVGFKVDLLKSRVPYPDIDTDILNATLAADTVDLYTVVPQMTGVAGSPATLESNEIGYAYKNMDGSYTNNQQFLYLLIQPTGAIAATHWNISITVERDVGE